MTKIQELKFDRIEECIPPHGMECIVLTSDGSVLNAFRDETWKGGFVNTPIRGVGGTAVPNVVGWLPKPCLREPSPKTVEVSTTDITIPDLNLNPEAVYDLKIDQHVIVSGQVLIFKGAGTNPLNDTFVLTTVCSNVDLYNQLVLDGKYPVYSDYIQHFRGPSDLYEGVPFSECACHTRKGIYDLIVNKAYKIS